MNLTISLLLAIFFLLLSIVTSVLIDKNSHMKANRFITPFNTVFAGVFITTFILLLPIYYSMCSGMQLQVLKTILFSIQGTFRVFTVDAEPSLIIENIADSVGAITSIYSTFISVLLVVDPIFTFGFLISFFKNVSAYIQLFIQRRKEIYVFSELNEKSLALANDIKKNHSKAAFVFCDVFDNNEEQSYELIGRAKEIGGICFKKDILAVNWKIHSQAKDLSFFAIGADESENIGQALKLVSMYGSVPNTRLYVFTTRIESELLLSHNQGIPMKVRRINEVQSLINRVLYEYGTELFHSAIPTADNEKTIHVVIVGLGSHGTEMLKALTWFCQMDGYRIIIDAYDKDDHAEEKFTALCPELMSDDYNGVYLPEEAEYKITIHSGMDVETKTFSDSIRMMQDVTYAFVALGSDENNVKTSVNMRMLFERTGIHPVIHTIVNNSDEKAALADIKNYRGQAYNIQCIGDIASSFSEGVIINSELENAALQRHKKWGNEEEFWQYEYNYRSSMASAIHMKARIDCGIPGANKSDDELTDEERIHLEVLEHRRWNAYMRAAGYIYSGSHEKSSRNDLAKMHHDLVDYSSLTEEEKRKDSRVGTK